MYGSNEYSSIPYGSNGGPFQIKVSDEINSEITGALLENTEINSQVTGKGIPDEINSEVTGKSLENTEVNSEISGLAIPNEINSQIYGATLENNDINSEISGKPLENEINSEIYGKRNGINEVNSEITGALYYTDINSEIIGKANFPIERTYRIIVKNELGDVIGEFDNFRALKFNKRLNNYGTASFEIPVTDDKAEELVSLRKNTVWIYYQVDGTSTLVWAGEQALREGRLDNAGNNWCTIHCFDWLEQLNGRYTSYEKRYEDIDAGQIAWDLIDRTQLQYSNTNTVATLPGTASVDSTIGDVGWTNVNNILDDTGANWATIEFSTGNTQSRYIKATNFGFSIPSNANILGIKVSAMVYGALDDSTNYIVTNNVKLVKNNVIQTTNYGNTEKWSSDDILLNFGGANDLWGDTFTSSDINNTNFGVVISGLATPPSDANLEGAVDYIKMTVYYEVPASNSNGDLGITKGTIEATVDRDRTYYNQNIMEAIVNLSNVLSGLDFEITNDKVFNVYNVIGVDRTNEIVLEYGHNIESVQIVEDFVHPVNRAIVLGQSTDDLNDLIRVERNDLTSQGEYKLREDVLTEMDVSETDTMNDKGDALLRKYGTPLIKVDMNMASVKNPNITQFGLGDAITLIIKSGIYNINAQYRVFEYEVEYSDNNSDHFNLILGNFTYE